MAGMEFKQSTVENFIGGDFKLPAQPATVGELKDFFQACIQELDGWGGDEVALSEVFFNRDCINVTLRDGIPK